MRTFKHKPFFIVGAEGGSVFIVLYGTHLRHVHLGIPPTRAHLIHMLTSHTRAHLIHTCIPHTHAHLIHTSCTCTPHMHTHLIHTHTSRTHAHLIHMCTLHTQMHLHICLVHIHYVPHHILPIQLTFSFQDIDFPTSGVTAGHVLQQYDLNMGNGKP